MHPMIDGKNARVRARRAALLPALALVAALAATAAYAGAPQGELREDALPHVCKGGPTPGDSCLANSTTCGTGKCVVDYQKGKTWRGVFTLIVDDTATGFDPDDRTRVAIAATLTLEVKVKGVTDILSKTFLNLDGATLSEVLSSLANDGPTIADGATGVKEDALISIFENEQMMTQILFQSGDVTMAQGLRDLLQTTGTPVITKVSQLRAFDHSPGAPAQNAATIIRAKVSGAVVNP
jgi:uncharacterized membrane protein